MTDRSRRGAEDPASTADHDHAARRERLRAVLPEGAAALLVTGPANVRYLAGFAASHARLVVGCAGDDVLITDERYRGPAEAAAGASGLALEVAPDATRTALAAVAGPVAVEAPHLTWAEARRLVGERGEAGVVATEGLVEGLRATKDARELALLARAAEVTERALAWLLDERLRPGVTERDLARALEARFVDEGAEGAAFPTIVAAGASGAVPHHEPTDRPLEVGELVTIDCGALVEGYRADLTRTVGVGRVAGRLADVHALVAAAAAAGRGAVVAGATAGDVDAAARGIIEDAGLGDRFVHPTGHGVGLEVHEAPLVARGSTAILAAGTVVTVEPGVYLPGVGGVRIEDTLVIADDGRGVPLTDRLPRDLPTP